MAVGFLAAWLTQDTSAHPAVDGSKFFGIAAKSPHPHSPADRDAKEFLRAAYQEKLDLLSAVAGKSQLAAADR